MMGCYDTMSIEGLIGISLIFAATVEDSKDGIFMWDWERGGT